MVQLPTFKLNFLANLAGTGWSALIQLIFVPIYLKLLGAEAFGLVGFYLVLQNLLQALDLGAGATINRELARSSAQSSQGAETRRLALTLEAGYWLIGGFIAAAIAIAAPLIASRWLRVNSSQQEVVESALLIMALLIACQWPISFYQSGLMGLKQQLLFNKLKIAVLTLGTSGTVLSLWLVSPTIRTFFLCQMAANAIFVGLLAISFRHKLPKGGGKPYFSWVALRRVWRFAAGMSGITISALMLTQLDKLILSRMLSLEMFGYYTLAALVGNGLYVFISPLFNTAFPHFSALKADEDESGLRRLYHRSSQIMTVIIAPIAATIFFFSFDLLLLWTGDSTIAAQAAPITSLLVVGTAVNGMMSLPYALRLALGWTRISLYINLFLIASFIPAVILLTQRFGAIGAATVWVALNLTHSFIAVPLTHRRILQGEAVSWALTDIMLPLCAVMLTVWPARLVLNSPMPAWQTGMALSLVILTALGAAALTADQIRSWLWGLALRTRPTPIN